MTSANRLTPVAIPIRGAERAINKRLKLAQRQVLAVYSAIPRTSRQKVVVNIFEPNEIAYDYSITPEQMEVMSKEIQGIITSNVLGSEFGSMPQDWYMKDFIEPPYRQGTLEEIQAFSQAVASGAISSPVTLSASPVLLSPEFLERLQKQYVVNYQAMKGMSDKLTAQVIDQINKVIDSGWGVRKATRLIRDRFEVASVDAARIARTTIGSTYNDAKMDTSLFISEDFGIETAVMHLSALSATTRESHAYRHGRYYSVDQQKRWWDKDANRINCLCTVETVYLDDPDLKEESQDTINQGKKFFEEAKENA